MDLEDLQPATRVRAADLAPSTDRARPAQRRIERVRPVRGADDDDLAARLQAVHQGEQLCDDPPLDLARDLVSLRRNRVQFVDEDDARGFLLGLFENVPQVLFALPVELGHDLRPGDRMEVRIRLRCDGLGEEGLARPRGTVQEDPFRRFDTEPLEQLRVAEGEFDHLADFADLAPEAADVLVIDLPDFRLFLFPRLLRALDLRFGLSEAGAG